MLDGVLPLLDDANPVVRGAAIWALGQIDGPRYAAEMLLRSAKETDVDARAEWQI